MKWVLLLYYCTGCITLLGQSLQFSSSVHHFSAKELSKILKAQLKDSSVGWCYEIREKIKRAEEIGDELEEIHKKENNEFTLTSVCSFINLYHVQVNAKYLILGIDCNAN